MNKKHLKILSVLNKLHEQEAKFKRELAKTFLEYLESLPTNKRIEQIESMLYETSNKNLPTVDRHLTSQERKCLLLASKGKEIKEMARILGLSQRTIKYHRANIIRKLEVPNLMAAVAAKNQCCNTDNDINNRLNFDTLYNFQMLSRSIIARMPGSVYWKDKEGVYLGNNDYAKQLMKALGLETDVIGKTDYDIFPKEVADDFKRADLKVLSGENLIVEEVTTFSDAKEMIQLSSKTPLLDKAKKIVGILGISLDITKLKKLS